MKVSDRLLILEIKMKGLMMLQKWQIGLTSILLAAMLAAWKSR